MKTKIENIVNSNLFNHIILLLIILNALSFGIETFPLSENVKGILNTFNWICICVFIIELLLKMYIYRKDFLKNGWNVFDLIVVGVSVFPEIAFFSSARVLKFLRVLKVFRATRVIAKIDQLRHIVQALVCALPSIGWTLALLAVIFYIFAVIGTNLYRNIAPEYFGDLWSSFYTLFQITMADDLGNISRPIIQETVSATIYFVLFVVIATILVLNVIIGIVVDSIDEVKKQAEKEALLANSDGLYKELEELEKKISIIKEQLLKKDSK